MNGSRRRFLALLGTTTSAAVAGCTGSGSFGRGRPSGYSDVAGWPSVGHDRSNTGFTPNASGPSDPDTRWSVNVSNGTSPPVAAGKRVLLATMHELTAVEAGTGEVAWQYSGGPDEQFWRTPAVRNGTVYVCTEANVTALNFGDGSVQWKREVSDPAVSPTVGRDGRYVYTGTWGGTIRAFDAKTGKDRWTQSVFGGVRGSLAIEPVKPTLYAATTDSVYAIGIGEGDPLWSEDLPGKVSTYPVYAEQTVYVGCSDGKIYALDTKEGGHPRWSTKVGSYINDAPAVRPTGEHTFSGTLFVADEKQLVAIAMEDGEKRWTRDLGSEVSGSPTIAGDTVYVPTSNGVVHAMKVGGGVGVGPVSVDSRRWKRDVTKQFLYPCPVADGTVYALSGNGDATLTALAD